MVVTNDSPAAEGFLSGRQAAVSQLAAIVALRWQIFRNSLRTLHGRLELVSRVFFWLMMGTAGLGAGLGQGFAAYMFVSHGRLKDLAILFWALFLFWQVFPIVATAFSMPFDSSNLLRFPVPFSSFFLLAVVYGLVDPASVAGCFWLVCIAGGIALADPGLLLPAVAVLLVFAVVNILLGRVVFAWLERWLAQRRTREILGVAFIFVMLSLQLLGPLGARLRQRAGPVGSWLGWSLPFVRALPPALAAQALADSTSPDTFGVVASSVALCGYGALFAWLLSLRLRAQYHGENLGQTSAPAAAPGDQVVQPSWHLWPLPAAVAAVFEKELRYLCRSGPMLFNIVMPLFVLLIFRLSAANAGDQARLFKHLSEFAFPIGAAYALLILSNLVYNCFGLELDGMDFYYRAPASFRDILLGKNLAHSAVLVLETALVCIGVCALFHPPSASIFLATLAGLLFALPVNLAAGNLLSLYFPKKFDFAMFGRQRASGATILVSFGVQGFVVGLAGVILTFGFLEHGLWLSDAALLVLAAAAAVGYFRLLRLCDRLALERREILTAELSRA